MKDIPNDTTEVWKLILESRENLDLLERQYKFEQKRLAELEAHYNRLSSIMAEEPPSPQIEP